jgi:Protein tyrosine and serine/threonine kinase
MGLYTPRMFINKVFKNGTRPATNVKWPQGLCRLMKECWDSDIFQRPTFVEIMKVLRDEMTLVNAQVAITMVHETDSVADSLPPERRIEEAFELSSPEAEHPEP